MIKEESKIKSILNLLDDRDEKAYELLESELLNYGPQALPFLKDALDNSIDELKTDRLNNLFHQINLSKTHDDLIKWKSNENSNLYEGLIILSRFQYPNLDVNKVTDLINKLRQDAWMEVNENLTALEKIRILNNVFFQINGFKGDTKDYYAPENNFINDVLINKKGNPLLLSAIYTIIAQSVDIPLYGVNLPSHFLVAYTDKFYSKTIEDISTENILFYVNPFGKGDVHNVTELKKFLRNLNIKTDDKYLLPCSNKIVIKRAINNLVNIYKNKGDEAKSDDYAGLLKIFED